MAFTDAIAAILDAIKTDAALSSIVVKDYPPDALNRNLILVAYPRNGSWGPDTMTSFDGTSDVRLGLHKKRSGADDGGLATDIAALLPYFDAVPRCLMRAWSAHKFDGTVPVIGRPGQPPLRAEEPSPGPDNWSGIDTVSIRWLFTITTASEDM